MALHANGCHMPTPAPQRDAEIYRRFRDVIIAAHCADKRDAHRCAGAITLTRDAVTLQCPRCGDAKQLISEKTEG